VTAHSQDLRPHLRLARHQREYAENLFTVIDDAMPSEWCDAIAARAAAQIAEGNATLQKPPTRADEERFVQGPYRFHMILGGQVRQHFPELGSLYHGWCGWLSLITQSDIIVSPHKNITTGEPSDVFYVNIKAYQAGDGELDWHQDRNPLACILYLNDCEGGALHVRRDRHDAGTERHILPRRGRLALVNGQRLWHAARPPSDVTRMAMVMSYFTPDNVGLANWNAAKERSILYADKA
jgi:hypothetical protein